ncbi:hypothetical protein [Streptomyces sp. NRRL S-495]|uniref:hypothetical protein n=1 Tax=Streptomyces sp. NRRL S-495 TaxID=1609133 RepID=UPI000B17984E|nr:hypothetical protein [Streptomyces sp. NRRL S-495]
MSVPRLLSLSVPSSALRLLRTELRRSVAPWAGAAVLAAALAFLSLAPGPWATGTTGWTAQWTSMALWTRHMLVFLWPLALGLGALQGLRDRRSRTAELLACTPRPARQRALAQAGPIVLALVTGFGLLLLVGGVRVLAGGTRYTPAGWLPISLVAALALAAGAVLGMGVARVVPSVLTPPALAVGAFLLTSVLRPTTDAAIPASAVPNRLSLLSPVSAPVRDTLLTIAAPVHLGQVLWLLGVAATGLALLAAATPRARLLALAPLLAGGALALAVLPADPKDTYVVDRAAAAPVCEGPVCVTALRQSRLDELAGPGREALRLLHAALGDRAPGTVRETVESHALGEAPERSADAVLVDFDDPLFAVATGERLTRALVAQGIAPNCRPRSDVESGTLDDAAAQSVAAAWVFGDLRPLDGTMHRESDQSELAGPVWERFRALPEAEQRRRMAALHEAAVGCADDVLATLTGVPTR